MPPPPPPSRLTKSDILSGFQCAKRLWWERHEPKAPELARDVAAVFRMRESSRAGVLARSYVAGALFEQGFEADGVFVAADILERLQGGAFALIEVKASTSVKDEHLPDVAVQLHVLRRAGLDVRRVELMHLSRECRYPDLSNLFVREDVTPVAQAVALGVPDAIAEQRRMLDGPLPDVPIGAHCTEPRECPFMSRCWAGLPRHHVGTLHRIGKQAWTLRARGWETVLDVPADWKWTAVQRRQRRALETGSLVVEPGLGEALREFSPPLAFLDFETVNPAVPLWPGCRPYDAIPVEMSCHVERGGKLEHHEWMAIEGSEDPRRPMAERVIEACRGARAVVTYHRSFEKGCLDRLIEAAPDLAADLRRIQERLLDLEVLVTEHVYHPDFLGSFSIKPVLPALVPGLGYDDLKIDDGQVASAELSRLLFEPDSLTAAERDAKRAALRAYCERDTWAMVKLLGRLRELGAPPPAPAAGPAGPQLSLGL